MNCLSPLIEILKLNYILFFLVFKLYYKKLDFFYKVMIVLKEVVNIGDIK